MNDNDNGDSYRAPLDLSQLKKKVQQFVNATEEDGRVARKSRDYFDNKQISPEMLAELRKRGQPAIYSQKIRPAIKGLMGILDAGVSDFECLPRGENDQDAADTVTKLVRYMTDANKHKRLRREVSENWLIQGSGAAILDWNSKRQIVQSERIHWDEFVFDPFSRELDFADARFLGIAKMQDEDEVKAAHPSFTGFGGSGSDPLGFQGWDDERARWWVTADRRRGRVVDLYYVDSRGEWHRAIFTDGELLYGGPSDYHDDTGESICPIEAISFDRRRDGLRYGPIVSMIPLQDEINSRRSKMLQLTTQRKTRQTVEYVQPTSAAIAKREAAKTDGQMPFGWEEVPAPDMAQGQMMLLQKAEADLDRLAPTPAVLGRVASENESGRARQILQQAGYTELARDFARFEDWEKNLITKEWWITREYLTTAREIRITDDPRSPQFLTVNKPITGTVLAPTLHPATGEPIVDPMTGQPHVTLQQGVVGMENSVGEMTVDIILTTVPDTATLQQEVFQTLTEWASSLRMDPFDPRFWAMIEMSTLPDKRGTIERLKRLKAEMDQDSAPMQQMQSQAMMEQHQADMAVKQSKAAKDAALAQLTTAKTEQTAQQVHMVEGSLWNHAYGEPHQPVWGSQGM